MKHTKLIFFTLFVLLTTSLLAQNGESYQKQIEQFEQFVEQQRELDRIPGISIGFMKGDFMWTKGFGYADLENKTPAHAVSAYRLASVTKPMTAVAVMQLAEKGKIDLQAEVQEYVPYFPEKPWPVRVGLLLGHLGGIPHYVNYDEEGHFKYHKDTREAIAVFEDFDLVGEPGTQYSYTSYGYNLLGAVIEGASGQSYGEYMRENIWGPLDMDATRLDDPVDLIPNRVKGYRIIDGEIKNSEFVDISSRFAAGGTRSTVGDLLRFAEGMDSGKLLSQESLNRMWTSMATGDGFYTNYGMGWGVSRVNGRFRVSHGGAQAETRTSLELYPLDDFAIAIACNLERADLSPYAQRLYQLILDAPWHIEYYTGNKTSNTVLSAMNSAFESGLSYFERHQNPLTSENKDIQQAFAYFNESIDDDFLNRNYKETEEKIEAGRHPVADRAYTRVGSFMAAQIQKKHGDEKLNSYHTSGAISFFKDYIDIYQAGSDSKGLKFDKQLETKVADWQKDWDRTWNETTQNMIVTAESNLSALSTQLQELFADATVYPSFVERFHDGVVQAFIRSDAKAALEFARTAYQIYPRSDVAVTDYGITNLITGNSERAETLITKAAEIDPDGAASANGLNRIAYQMAGMGAVDPGLALLKIAVELHPEVANLYDSIGEFYLNKGEIESSIAWYKKAIKMDPDFENPKRMLQKIREEHNTTKN